MQAWAQELRSPVVAAVLSARQAAAGLPSALPVRAHPLRPEPAVEAVVPPSVQRQGVAAVQPLEVPEAEEERRAAVPAAEEVLPWAEQEVAEAQRAARPEEVAAVQHVAVPGEEAAERPSVPQAAGAVLLSAEPSAGPVRRAARPAPEPVP